MSNGSKEKKMDYDWKDILAMIIAVYQILLTPLLIIILFFVLLALVFNLIV